MTEDRTDYKLNDLKMTIDFEGAQDPCAGLYVLNCIIKCRDLFDSHVIFRRVITQKQGDIVEKDKKKLSKIEFLEEVKKIIDYSIKELNNND